MREIGLTLRLSEAVLNAQDGAVTTACMYTGRQHQSETDTLVTVTARLPNDQVAQDLRARQNEWNDAGLQSVTALADALAPSTIAAAVWDGHRYAEDLGETINRDDTPFLREVTYIAHRQAKGQN